MEIQSLSVCVPCGCPNSCKFCVSRMHDNLYPNMIENCRSERYGDTFRYIDRLEYARDNGVHCLILTGTGEPMMNPKFLTWFGGINKTLSSPFRHIEIQTSGIEVVENIELLQVVGVQTVSLSLSSLDSYQNELINGIKKEHAFHIGTMCRKIKYHDFNLRLSLNMSDAFNDVSPEEIFEQAKKLEADQITFRQLWGDGSGSPQDKWIQEHPFDEFGGIEDYIHEHGMALHKLSFGATKYDVHGISVVIDDDCMADGALRTDELRSSLKYLILRPDCRLYSQWQYKGSLIY